LGTLVESIRRIFVPPEKKFMSRLAVVLLCLSILPLLAGCSDGKGIVKGTVTFDETPVSKGIITFVSTEGPLVREGAVIVDGMFTATVPPGAYKIELNAQRIVGKRVQKGFDGNDEELPLTEELFPDRYNAKTELTEVIRPGENTIRLDLKDRP
jgi:hypothetical protein